MKLPCAQRNEKRILRALPAVAMAVLVAITSAQVLAQPPSKKAGQPTDTATAPNEKEPSPPAKIGGTAEGEYDEYVNAPPAKATPVVLPPDLLAKALRPVAGGLKPKQVAAQAIRTSPNVKASYAALRAAAAKVDQALVAYFPQLSVAFTYSRLSKVDDTFDVEVQPGVFMPMEIPTQLNSYSLTGQLGVPFSDYLLRLTQAYASASRAEQAKKLEARAKELQVGANAKVAYFNWIRAKGQSAVADLAVAQAKAHLSDARKTFQVGLISKADVLRLEAQVAQAEHLSRASRAFEAVAEQQLRTFLHLRPTHKLAIGVDVMRPPAQKKRRQIGRLHRLALARRVELKALDATIESLDKVKSLTAASYFPRLDGFFNTNYANPNQRFFGTHEEWNFSWELGVRLSWTINDTFTTLGAAKEADANKRSVEQQKKALADGIKLSVTAAYHEGVTAHSAIKAASRREVAAVEGLRVRRDLFRVGKATSTDIVDSETELTQARLQRVNAHVDVLVARAKLEHALGGS